MAFSAHFEKWLTDTLTELKRVADEKKERLLLNGQHYFNSNALNFTEKMSSQYEDSLRSKTANTAANASGKHNYYRFAYNEDDAMDIEDDEDSRKLSSHQRVAKILGKSELETEPSESGEDFYPLPNGLDDNENFEPDFTFRYSASIDFSDEERSVVSEPKSYADDPDIFMRNFMEPDFVDINRVELMERSGESDSKVKSPGKETDKLNSQSPKRFFNSIFSPSKTKTKSPDGFEIRYVRTANTVEDNYIDDDLRPVALAPEDLVSSKQDLSEGILPMNTAINMTLESEEEEETMLDLSRDTRLTRQSHLKDTDPIVATRNQTNTVKQWAVKHRKLVIIISILVGLCIVGGIVVIIFLVT